ncbi:MupA/Atu3671 family FMN-dependent luciferase-like monooxygenase [Paraflavitalea pollutisoli]|uniref:MupA/Atu3671 family FMN-dependent luciferase-like monooxygenase n=1 Tax=Paraflavitalea pollutisoli TaxID=3034143 RepID=UPI0023EC7F89|nr:MupA/Atu3671 family FMN-dependent luciferase-like monooxygenase [Paraflavitalea sp. H1-2-19X]
MESILKRLREQNIVISLENNDLKIKFNGKGLPPELLQELRDNKQQLVQYLSGLEAGKNDRIQPIGRQESYPLSSAQNRLWILCQFEGASRAYNMPGVYVLEGKMDVSALEDAFGALVARHEILRTSFREDRYGEIRQFVHPAEEVDFQLLYNDWQASDDAAALLQEAIRSDIRYSFQLSAAPLLRACIYQVAPEKYVFTCVMHHIVSDGWSLEVLFSELLALYHALLHGTAIALQPLRIQYKDYAYWQDQQLNHSAANVHKSWWLQQLAGELPVLQLPEDFPRPREKTYRGGRVTRSVDKQTMKAFRQFCQARDASLFMGLLSVVYLLLYRYTGQTDIVLGSPTAGRDHMDLEDQIGLYLNTIALRTRFSGDDRMDELLHRVREVTLGAFEHQSYPFERLVDDLNVQRDLSRSPLFDVMVILQNAYGKGGDVKQHFGDVRVSGYPFEDHVVSKLDLTFDFVEHADELQATIEFNTDIYREQTAQQLIDHLLQLLQAVLEHPATPLHQFDYLTATEKHRLLTTFNDTHTAVPVPDTILHMLEEQVRKTPEATALIVEGRVFSYRMLNERANRIGHYLRIAKQVKRNDLVGLQLERNEWMLFCLLGILKSGAAYVPIDPTYPPGRIEYILSDSNCVTVIDEPLLEDIKERLSDYEATDAPIKVQPADLAYCMYTSGTTGNPKGCLLTHANVVNFFIGMNGVFSRTPGTLLALTNNTFDISVLELVWTLTNGYTVVLQKDVLDVTAAGKKPLKPIDFSLFYFGNADAGTFGDKYKLLFDGAQYADCNGYTAVWTPERHFHEFGGLYPNPSVLGAALAAVTKRVQIRAGSVVLPLHHPVRIAEEWAVVDNISHGRVAIACASGWHVGDFIFSPASYARKTAEMYRHIETIQQLWRGEPVVFEDGNGNPKSINIYPRPVQAQLPLWITSANSADTFRSAGKLGAGVLTHLLGETVEGLAVKIQAYRAAFAESGHDPSKAKVALMLHTYVGEDMNSTYEKARGPFMDYLRTSVGLLKAFAVDLNMDIEAENFSEEDMQSLLEHAFDRYVTTASLIGTRESCTKMLERLSDIGVDEVACLIDFGVGYKDAMEGLYRLTALKGEYNAHAAPPATDHSIHTQLQQYQVSHLQCTPSMAALLKTAEGPLRSLRTVLLGGERLPLSLANELHEAIPGLQLYNMYGPTETTIWSACAPIGRDAEKIVVGKPIANTAIYILDQHRQLLPLGVAGELFIGGKGVAMGYLHKEELTAERFVDSPFVAGDRLYRTGDFGKWLPDGSIEYIGRKDDQVKINGHRIELGEVEAALLSYTQVSEVAAWVRVLSNGEKELIACFVGSEPIDATILRDFLRNRLPASMIPAHFIQMPQLPLTANGKVDRKRLPAPEMTVRAEHAFVSPRNAIEQQLVQVWQELLGRDQIGVTDNFFDLGGNSIRIVKMVSLVNKMGGKRLSVASAFRFPTISVLAAYLSEVEDKDGEGLVKEIENSVDVMDRTMSLLNAAHEE